MRDRLAVLLFIGSVWLAACGDHRGATSDSTAAVASTDSSSMRCGAAPITGEGIGALTIGLTVERVRALCNVVNDTVVRATEGQMSRVLMIALDSDTVMTEVVNDRVWRILVRSQGLYTADSISVGSSVVMTLTKFPDLNPMVGEGYLYAATASHCGMSFRLSEPPSSAPHGEWTSADLRSLHPLVHVTRILIFGCKSQP